MALTIRVLNKGGDDPATLTKSLMKAAQMKAADDSAVVRSMKESGTEIIPYPYDLDPTDLATLYDTEPTHSACCDTKANAVICNGYKFVHDSKEAKEPPETMKRAFEDAFPEGQEDLIIKAEKDFQSIGNAWIEVIRDNTGRIADSEALGNVVELKHIPAPTMWVLNPDSEKGAYVQVCNEVKTYFRKFGSPRQGTLNEIIHLKQYTPSNYWYGLPRVWAALRAALGNRLMGEHLIEYFEDKGIPGYLLILDGAQDTLATEDEDTLTHYMNQLLEARGAKICLLGTPEGTTTRLEELREKIQIESFDIFRGANRDEICRVHRTPPRLIGIIAPGSLGGTSEGESQFDLFKKLVVRPRQNAWEKLFYKVFLESNNRWNKWRVELNEVDMTDLLNQMNAWDTGVRVGVTSINEVRAQQGRPAVKAGDEHFIVAGGVPVRIQDIGKDLEPPETPKPESKKPEVT